MRHADTLSQASIFFLSDILIHRLKEAQLKHDWARAVKSLVEKEPYDDFFFENGVLFKDPNHLFLSPWKLKLSRTLINKQFSDKNLVDKPYISPKLMEKVKRMDENCVRYIIVNAKKGKKEGF